MAARYSHLVTLGDIKILQGRMSVNELPSRTTTRSERLRDEPARRIGRWPPLVSGAMSRTPEGDLIAVGNLNPMCYNL